MPELIIDVSTADHDDHVIITSALYAAADRHRISCCHQTSKTRIRDSLQEFAAFSRIAKVPKQVLHNIIIISIKFPPYDGERVGPQKIEYQARPSPFKST